MAQCRRHSVHTSPGIPQGAFRSCFNFCIALLVVLLQFGEAALPRIIHWTRPPVYPGASPLPVLVWQVALRSWSRFFPRSQGFQHFMWTDANLSSCMEAEFPSYLSAFHALPGGVERSDVGRYCILHKHGGIYADLDYEVRTNFFSDLAEDVASLVESPYAELSESVQNSLMASPARHPLWREAISEVFQHAGLHRWDDVEGGTGPRMLTALLTKSHGDGLAVSSISAICGAWSRREALWLRSRWSCAEWHPLGHDVS